MRADWINGGLLLVAVLASCFAVLWQSDRGVEPPQVVSLVGSEDPSEQWVVDARGREVEARSYQRIVSLNTVADHLLLNLVEPERLIAITGYTQDTHEEAWRFGERAVLAKSQDVEAVLGLQPDLVITSEFADEAFMARIRERGIPVFDLGNMRGVSTTLEDIAVLGSLLKEAKRAEELERSYRRELAALLASRGDEPRPKGLFLTVLGDSFFGGHGGTSYADVLRYGGMEDLAEEFGYQDWPRYTPEQILAMNPGLLLTQVGMGEVICQHSALRKLPACGSEGHVVELHGRYHADPGLGIVEASSQVQALLQQLP